MLQKIIFTSLALIYAGSIAKAQSQVKKDSSTVIIFNQGSSITSVPTNLSSEENIIKVKPFGFLAGKIPFSYEKKLNDLISVQLSVGITMKNYLRSAVLGGANGTESDLGGKVTFKDKTPEGFSDATDPLYSYDTRKAKLGYLISLQPRIHLNNDGLEGPFIALSADFYRYNFSTKGLIENSGELKPIGSLKDEFENIKDVMVNFGFQSLYDRISLEYSIGAGIRSVNGVKYIAGTSNNGFYEALSPYTKNTGINVGLNFKVGYHF